MRVALPVSAKPHWPPGVTIRGFRPDQDEAAWLDVNNRAFEGHAEQAGWTAEDLAVRTDQPWFDAEGLRMVWAEERLVAFNWTKLHPYSEPRLVGEIFVIAVDPDRQGSGLGRATIVEGLRDLSARQGAEEAVLHVDTAERSAVHLYRSLGFETEHVSRAFRAEVGSGR